MKAPHLARFLNLDRKRKAEAGPPLETKQRPRPNTSEPPANASLSLLHSTSRDDTVSNEKENLFNKYAKENDGAVALSRAGETEAAGIVSTKDPHIDSADVRLHLRPSPATEQIINAVTASDQPDSAEHRTFIESILKQHAQFVSDTCQTFQSDPLAMQTAIQAHQHCLDSLLELYYKIHTHDSSAERASALFQENYKQLQRLHQQASKSRSATAKARPARNDAPSTVSMQPQSAALPPRASGFAGRKDEQDRRGDIVAKGRDASKNNSLLDQYLMENRDVERFDPKPNQLVERMEPPSSAVSDPGRMNASSGEATTRPSSSDLQPSDQCFQNPMLANNEIVLTPVAANASTSLSKQRKDDREQANANGIINKPTAIGHEPMMRTTNAFGSSSSRASDKAQAIRSDDSTNQANEDVCDAPEKDALAKRAPSVASHPTAETIVTGTATSDATASKADDSRATEQSTPSNKRSKRLEEWDEPVGWTCSDCTLINSQSKRRCQVCHARRPVSTKASLTELPERTPRLRRKKLDEVPEASHVLFGDSEPTASAALCTAAAAHATETTNLEADHADLAKRTAALVSLVMDSHAVAATTGAAERKDGMDGPRRITLDQGVSLACPESTDEQRELYSPSFESQETVDPSLSPLEMDTSGPNKPSSSSYEKEGTANAPVPPHVRAAGSGEKHFEDDDIVRTRDDGPRVVETTETRKRAAEVCKPYAAPWQSNLTSRRFDRELEEATVQAHRTRSGPIRTAGPDPQQWYTAKSTGVKKKAETNDIWNDSETQEPYHEVVRGKARKDLPTHDCPECAAFYKSLIVDSQSMDVRQFCRHRSRFGPPPETPEDFWELDFIDELKEKRKAEAEARQAAVAESDAAKRKTG